MSIKDVTAKAGLMGLHVDENDDFVILYSREKKSIYVYNNNGERLMDLSNYSDHTVSYQGCIAIITRGKGGGLTVVNGSDGKEILRDKCKVYSDNVEFLSEDEICDSEALMAVMRYNKSIYLISNEYTLMDKIDIDDSKFIADCELCITGNREYLAYDDHCSVFKRNGSSLICKDLVDGFVYEVEDGSHMLGHDTSVLCRIHNEGETDYEYVFCKYKHAKDIMTVPFPAMMHRLNKVSRNNDMGRTSREDIFFEEMFLECQGLIVSALRVYSPYMDGRTRLFPVAQRGKDKYKERAKSKVKILKHGLVLVSCLEMPLDKEGNAKMKNALLLYNYLTDKVMQVQFRIPNSQINIGEKNKRYDISICTLTVSEDLRNYLTEQQVKSEEEKLFGDSNHLLLDNNIIKQYQTTYRIDWKKLEKKECQMVLTDSGWRFYLAGTDEEVDLWQEYR